MLWEKEEAGEATTHHWVEYSMPAWLDPLDAQKFVHISTVILSSDMEKSGNVRAPLMPSARQRGADDQPVEMVCDVSALASVVKIWSAWGPPQVLVTSPEQGTMQFPLGASEERSRPLELDERRRQQAGQ